MIKNSILVVITALFFLTIAGSITGCGYKAPPFYPKEKAV